MIRLIAAAGFVVALATSAQAITPAPLPQPDGMITQVRFGCGAITEQPKWWTPVPLTPVPPSCFAFGWRGGGAYRGAWAGLVAPAGTPAAVVKKLNTALREIIDSLDVQARFKNVG